jgi:anti-anti-sigma factor
VLAPVWDAGFLSRGSHTMGAPQVVVLPEELDIYNEADLQRVLEPLAGPCVIDMTRVRYIDASAISQLVRLAKRIGRRNVALVVPSPHIRKVLDILHLGELFTIGERLDGQDSSMVG